MAPIKKRTTARAKSKRAPTSDTAAAPTSRDESAFGASKKDKAKIKHSSFVSRIEKSAVRPLKRRRPNKKLIVTLESLADALPVTELANGDGRRKTDSEALHRRSLKSRPGAMKRKEKLEKTERERFNHNLVSLAGNGQSPALQDRWAALKAHVQQNAATRPGLSNS